MDKNQSVSETKLLWLECRIYIFFILTTNLLNYKLYNYSTKPLGYFIIGQITWKQNQQNPPGIPVWVWINVSSEYQGIMISGIC